MFQRLFIFIAFVLYTNTSLACLDTHQFKTFPVGISKSKIITIDVIIKRASQGQGGRKFKLDLSGTGEMWYLYSYISVYDEHQRLESNTPLDTLYSIGESYTDTLHYTFLEGLSRIEKEFKDIEYFTPEYISYCDYQQQCNRVQMKSDTLLDKDYFIFDGESYEVNLLKDEPFYGFDFGDTYGYTIKDLYINSIRIYKSKEITLLVNHLAIGSSITNGSRKTSLEGIDTIKSEYITWPKEYNPQIEFTTLKTSTYQEPVMHHGKGLDVFVVQRH